ncbi:MAG: DUF2892 domain-containing protein [Candidatus Zixiibacteriota bacterium]
MKANVGGADRVVRIIAGLAILTVGVVLKSWWGLVGILPLISAIGGFCPLYTLIGINTGTAKKQA